MQKLIAGSRASKWMETGKAHYGMSEYQKNLDAFAPFLDRVLLNDR